MNALKRLAASTMLGIAMTVGAAQAAVAQCYDVYEWAESRYYADGSSMHIYEYSHTVCYV